MKQMKRGLAVVLALLLIMPDTPVSIGRALLTEAAELEESVVETENEKAVDEETAESSESVRGADNAGTDSKEILDTVEDDERNDEEPGDVIASESENDGEEINLDTVAADSEDRESNDINEGELEENVKGIQDSEKVEDLNAVDVQETEEDSDKDQPTVYEGDIIASGVDGNITWTIDADGKLTIEGTGNFSANPIVNSNLWGEYRESITTAEVKVTGMTDASRLFTNCSNLLSLDLSGFDTSSVTNMNGMFSSCNNLASLDLSNFDTSNVTSMNGMFYECNSLTSLDLSNFDTSNVTSMSVMFCECNSLTSLDLSGFDTSNVTDMIRMFYECSSLTSLDMSGFDTSNVTNMRDMFYECGSLTSLDLSSFDTSNVTDMSGMFYECSSLTSLDMSGFDTSNVTNMRDMFYECGSLTSLDLSSFDTSNVTDMCSMFQNCSNLTSLDLNGFCTNSVTGMIFMFCECGSLVNLDLSNFDTSNVTTMCSVFNGCRSLVSLNLSNFNTSNVTDMVCMFYNCSSLTNLDLSSFDTSNVTNMNSMFLECSNLTSLDLSNFDTRNVTDMMSMFYNCSNLTKINTPYNTMVSAALLSPVNTIWRLSDGTEVTELPQGLSYSVEIKRYNIDNNEDEDTSPWFKVTGAQGYNRYTDLFIAENNGQSVLDTLFDPLYKNAYQVLFINDESADLTVVSPFFESITDARIYVQGQEQTSGVSVQDFSQGAVQYTAEKSGSQREHWITFAKKETGAKLFVNGPSEREIYLTDYFNNQHDILIANVGDTPLTEIKVELLDAQNVKLDDTWTLSSTLAAFTQVPGENQAVDAVMTNFGKVRLVPDGEGEVRGTLKITADGQEPVYITLTGYSANPRIITTTPEMNMDDVIRVKYVPYSYTVETNNELTENKVTFSVERGTLAKGLQMYPATGEIYGVPLEAGEFTVTVKATYSRPEFLPSYAQLTLIVKDNTDGNVNVATDPGYDIIQRVQNIILGSASVGGSQTLISKGEYAEFLAVYFDGVKLTEGIDYESEPGSTRITILNQVLESKGEGTHTLGVEFRTQDTNTLRRAAQNYIVSSENSGRGNNDGSGNSGTDGDYLAGAAEFTASAITHVVQPGDSLWKLAARYYGSGLYWYRIYQDNKATLQNPNLLRVGQVLTIYLNSSGTVSTRNGTEQAGSTYTVQKGDSLWKIAAKIYGNGNLWRRIYEANQNLISNYMIIFIKQVFFIPNE